MLALNRMSRPLLRQRRSAWPAARCLSTSDDEAAAPAAVAYPSGAALMMHRFTMTAEVTVSKIFPAGFGWQTSSIVAENIGYGDPTSLPFFLITGLGDFCGVLAGHTGYYLIKKAVVDPSIDAGATVGTGWWLATAAFFSGAMWQPTVNVLQGAAVPFNGVFLGTWAVCGAAFYGGLRLGRMVYPFIDDGSYENLKNDASLSLSIGGATAFFVGTDAAYAEGAGNWLIDVVGVQDADSDILGCVKAGSSTALGFFAAQTAENASYTAGKLWLDP